MINVWLKSHKIVSHDGDRPQSSWAISLAEIKFRVLQTDQPGVLLLGTDLISGNSPGT